MFVRIHIYIIYAFRNTTNTWVSDALDLIVVMFNCFKLIVVEVTHG